jgi:hypothetical protein
MTEYIIYMLHINSSTILSFIYIKFGLKLVKIRYSESLYLSLGLTTPGCILHALLKYK